MLKPTAATDRPLLVDGGDNRIHAFLLWSCLFGLNQLCFHTFKCWRFKTCQQPRQVSHLLLSHDIHTFNQGHKIAAIYVFFIHMLTNYYDCRQHLALIYNIFLQTLSSTQTLNISGDITTVNLKHVFLTVISEFYFQYSRTIIINSVSLQLHSFKKNI